MILVDSSVWIDHFRRSDAILVSLLETGAVLCHDFIIGELALGNLRQRDIILADLSALPSAVKATHDEVMHFIARRQIMGQGIGYIDAHLLAAVSLTQNAVLWTRDKRLSRLARQLGIAFSPP